MSDQTMPNYPALRYGLTLQQLYHVHPSLIMLSTPWLVEWWPVLHKSEGQNENGRGTEFSDGVVVFFVRLPSSHAPTPHSISQPHHTPHTTLHRNGTPRLFAGSDLAGALRRGLQSSCGGHRPCRPITPTTYNWPAAGTTAAAMQLPGRHGRHRPRTLASRVILQDSSCCLHRGPNVLFFAAERPQDDATQMSFQIAMVEMNPPAFRAVVRPHKQRRRQQLQREEREKQRLRRVQQRREEPEQRGPSAPADDESSSLLLPPNPSYSSSVSSSFASSRPMGTHPAANVGFFFSFCSFFWLMLWTRLEPRALTL